MYEFAKLLDEAARGRKRASRLHVNALQQEAKGIGIEEERRGS